MADLATAPVVYTPHPVTLEGQRHETLNVGETVQEFLDRVIGEAKAEHLEVRLGGAVVPRSLWARVKPKAASILEVRGAVGKQALILVAYAFLTWWTMGAFAAAGAAGGTVFGLSGFAAYAATAAVYAAGPARGGRVIR